MTRSLLVVVSLGVVLLALWVSVLVQAQTPSAQPVQQCQSLLRVKQDLATYSEQLAAQLLLRAEKAEQELATVKQQLETLQKPAAKE